MHSDRTLVELVGLIYVAAGDAGGWTPFIERLADVLRTPWCFLHVHDLRHGRCDVTSERGLDPAYRRSYEQYYVAKNMFFIHGKGQLEAGKVCVDEMLCPDEILFRSEFYNDWLEPQRMARGINATILKNDSVVSLLGLVRERGTPRPARRDIALVEALMPHLQRGVQTHQKLADLKAIAEVATDALDRWSLGVILLDSTARLVSMNAAAQTLIERRDGLYVDASGLRASRPDETVRLRKLIHDAIATKNEPQIAPGGVMPVTREGSERPLQLLVAPRPSGEGLTHQARVACVVFVSNPAAAAETDPQLLQRHYGLTQTESKVAALLAQGHDVKRISDELNVRLNTTRTHVRRVLRKTSTKRQVEFAIRILTDPTSSRLK